VPSREVAGVSVEGTAPRAAVGEGGSVGVTADPAPVGVKYSISSSDSVQELSAPGVAWSPNTVLGVRDMIGSRLCFGFVFSCQ
jgi:hypothetical protein